MNCWEQLCIKPTNDEKAIKIAYAKILKQRRPDDDPEKFMELRVAYEEAVKLSQMMSDDEEDKQSVIIETNQQPDTTEKDDELDNSVAILGDSKAHAEHIMQEAMRCYEEYDKRMEYKHWKAFINSIKGASIEVKEYVFMPLTVFFIQHSFVNYKVYQELNKLFDYTHNEKLLSEELGEEATDYFIYKCYNAVFEFNPYIPKGVNSENVEVYLDLRERFIYNLYSDDSTSMLDELRTMTKTDGLVDYFVGLKKISIKTGFDSGYKSLQKAAKLEKEDLGILLAAGYAALKSNNVDSAIDIFSKCMDIQSQNTHCIKGLAMCYYANGNYMESVTLFEVLYEETPHDFTCKTYILKCYQSLQEELLTKQNLSSDEMMYLMKSYQALSSYKEAYKAMIEIKDTLDANGLLLLAELSENIVLMKLATRVTHYDEAIAALEKEGINPYIAYTRKARVYYKNYDSFFKSSSYKASMASLEKSLELNPNQPECYYYIGLLHYDKLNYKEGLEAVEKAISMIDAYKYEYAYLRVRCNFELKNYKECLEECEYIDDHSYGHIKSHITFFMSGVCYYYLGEYGNAKDALIKAKDYGYIFKDLKSIMKKVEDKITKGVTGPPVDELISETEKNKEHKGLNESAATTDEATEIEEPNAPIEIDPEKAKKIARRVLMACLIVATILFIASRFLD